jgi:hypothetical protein
MLLRDQPGQDLLMGQAVSGIEAAILFQALTLNCGNPSRRLCQSASSVCNQSRVLCVFKAG